MTTISTISASKKPLPGKKSNSTPPMRNISLPPEPKQKAVSPEPKQKAIPPAPEQKTIPPALEQKIIPPTPEQKAIPSIDFNMTDKEVDLVKSIVTKASKKTIEKLAIGLLCHTGFHENAMTNAICEPTEKHARSVGLPYLRILRFIKFEYPLSKTSIACLRWYLNKMKTGAYGVLTIPVRRPK